MQRLTIFWESFIKLINKKRRGKIIKGGGSNGRPLGGGYGGNRGVLGGGEGIKVRVVGEWGGSWGGAVGDPWGGAKIGGLWGEIWGGGGAL